MAVGKNGTTCTYICFPYKPSIWLCCSDRHLARGRITTQKKCVCHWHDWDGKRRWLARLLSPGDGGTTGITWNSTLQKKKKPRWWKREREQRGRVMEKKTQRTGVHSMETVVLRQGRFPCWYVLRLDLEVLNTCLFFRLLGTAVDIISAQGPPIHFSSLCLAAALETDATCVGDVA